MEIGSEVQESGEILKKYLTFSIGEEIYGILIEYVTEIIEMEEITKVPDLPIYAKGILNLRGKVITIMDARLRFKKNEKGYDDRTCIVVINISGFAFGLIVDSVEEVTSIPQSNISPTPTANLLDDTANQFVDGVGKLGNKIVLLIDCSKLIA